MSTKKLLDDFASRAIFNTLTNPLDADIKPVTLYTPSRKVVDSQGRYSVRIDLFNSKPELFYGYFYNLQPIPRLQDSYIAGSGYTNYIYTIKDFQRHDIVSTSMFYFGFVTYNLNKVYSLFVEDNYEKIVGIFKGYFKRGFFPSEIENYFPHFPKCNLFKSTYYCDTGSDGAFKERCKDDLYARLVYGTTRRVRKRIQFSKCIALTDDEYTQIKDLMVDICIKVNIFLLMVGYSMHRLGSMPAESNFYTGFEEDVIREETEQCHSHPEEEACSSSQEDHQSDQQ